MRTTVVTGANRGIGLELAKQASERGDQVIALCRKASDALKALDVRVIEGIDVSNDNCAEFIKEALGDQQIDILINNAGVMSRQSIDDLNFDETRWQFEVNSLGPLRVTKALFSNFKEGSKVAIITSRMGSIADNTSGSHYGYRMSKAAVNMAGASLAHDLKPQGIAVALLHPGYVKTDMTGHSGMVEPPESAQNLLKRIDDLNLENTGSFYHMNGEELPW
jgi:NAD(P)-dependent dehydrogenase (short-subunit alcohol dehydrogenase family)